MAGVGEESVGVIAWLRVEVIILVHVDGREVSLGRCCCALASSEPPLRPRFAGYIPEKRVGRNPRAIETWIQEWRQSAREQS